MTDDTDALVRLLHTTLADMNLFDQATTPNPRTVRAVIPHMFRVTVHVTANIPILTPGRMGRLVGGWHDGTPVACPDHVDPVGWVRAETVRQYADWLRGEAGRTIRDAWDMLTVNHADWESLDDRTMVRRSDGYEVTATVTGDGRILLTDRLDRHTYVYSGQDPVNLIDVVQAFENLVEDEEHEQ